MFCQNGEEKFYQCKIKGKLRLENFKSTNPVIRHRVNFSLEHNDEENWHNQNILEKRLYSRKSAIYLSNQVLFLLICVIVITIKDKMYQFQTDFG